MSAAPLLQLMRRSDADVLPRLIDLLKDGAWHHRDYLATKLYCSVRAIRDAANQSKGEIISANDGLKLTRCCTQEEYDEAIGRFTSQIHEMTLRVLATKQVWESRCP